MGEIRKINPYTGRTMPIDEPIEVPHVVKEYIKHCDVVTDMTPEEAKRLRLENISILNEIVNDVTVSATTRVQAVQAREKILKDLMGNVGTGVNQRSLADLKSLLSEDEDASDEDVEDIEGPVISPSEDSDEIDSDSKQISFEELRKQMLDETEE